MVADHLMARRVATRPAPPQRPLIVSVGNLALGGTGKTPVVATLARDLAEHGLAGCILTRGFGSALEGPLQVLPDNAAAGDEARLLAASLDASKWSVVQARRRERGLGLLQEQWPQLDVVILEDGHQTAGVGRHVDVVILDSWSVREGATGRSVVPRTGCVFPLGPWRESARGAQRAAIWLLETDEAVPAQGTDGATVSTFSRTAALSATHATAPVPGGDWAVLSGIARPVAFEQAAGRLIGRDPLLAIRADDHQAYGPNLADRIATAVTAAGADSLLTTAKDWIKLENFWTAAIPVWTAELSIHWGQKNALPDLIRQRIALSGSGTAPAD